MALSNDFFIQGVGGAVSPKLLGVASATTAGGVYMASLGGYQFALETAAFEELQRDTQYRWSKLNRIGRAPARQFTGLDDDTIELRGVIYPHFRGGVAQVGLMRSAAGRGQPLPLIYAFESRGQYCGLWCILGVREGRTVFFRDGMPRRIEFSLTLGAYGEDASAGGAIEVTRDSLRSLTGIQVPTSMSALAASLPVIEALPQITSTSPLADVRSAASALSGLSSAVATASSQVRGTIAAGVGALTNGARAILPADTLAMVRQLDGQAQDLLRLNSETQSAVAVFRDQAAQIKSVAGGLGGSLGDKYRAVSSIGGALQSVTARLSTLGASPSLQTVDRIQAAGFSRNMAAQADRLIFGTAEGRAQSAALADKITLGD